MARSFAGAAATLPRPEVDPNGLLEYSVVYTDRTLNHMSKNFQGIMNDIRGTLSKTYNCETAIVIPGAGTYGLEAVARAFGTGKKCLVVRNGYFSYRWSHIFDACSIPAEETVLKARPVQEGTNPQYAPPPLEEVVSEIKRIKPEFVCMPHVETSSGIIVPDDYIKGIAEAAHSVGAYFALDCIASGCVWVDMEALGVDLLISAPQKGWSGPACAGLVMCNARAKQAIESGEAQTTSMSLDLKSWLNIQAAYAGGGHAYYATMPTESLAKFHEVQAETAEMGFEEIKRRQIELGARVRDLLKDRGCKSVAPDEFAAPSVVVSYTPADDIKSGAKFAANGMQIAAGVPLMLDDFTQSGDYKTFRLGLFGLDKLGNIDRTVDTLEKTLDKVL
jgi:aspartate aminotransferase-like enzyme